MINSSMRMGASPGEVSRGSRRLWRRAFGERHRWPAGLTRGRLTDIRWHPARPRKTDPFVPAIARLLTGHATVSARAENAARASQCDRSSYAPKPPKPDAEPGGRMKAG